MHRFFTKPGGWAVALGLAIALFVAVNVVARSTGGARLDLTEDRLFTLSEGTEGLLGQLERPVSLTYYYSEKLGEAAPTYATFARRVRDMLNSFAAASGGKITVREVDPEPFSEVEDEAVEAGIQPIALGTGGLDNVYFGLSAQVDLDDGGVGVGAVPLFQHDRAMFLEYDLAKMVSGLAHGAKRKVGVIASVDLFGVGAAMGRSQTGAWSAVEQLRDAFDIVAIETAGAMWQEAPDLLLILHPGPLEDDMLYAIDQFLLSGGDAVVFLDRNFESAYVDQGLAPSGPVSIESDLGPILERWGVSLPAEKVVGDRTIARLVNAGTQNDVVPTPYVGWLDVKPGQMSDADPITAQLNQLLVPSPSAIKVDSNAPVTLEPLITTTPAAALLDRDLFGQQPDVIGLAESFQPDDGAPYLIAARISGSVSSAFSDGPPEFSTVATVDEEDTVETDETKATPTLPPHVPQSVEPLNVVLVADADMLVDRFWVQVRNLFGQTVRVPHSDNGAFLYNALDSLAGAEALIGLRSRGTGERPFVVIDDLQRRAEERYRAEERALRTRLAELQAQLQNPEQAETDAVETAREELLDTRRRLREVNRSLNEEIDSLETRLAFLNIGLVPFLVACAGAIVSLRRRSVR